MGDNQNIAGPAQNDVSYRLAHFPFKYMHISQSNGPFEILMDPLENSIG